MYKKSFEMKHFRVSLCAEGPELTPSWSAGVARHEKMRKTAPMEAVGSTIAGGRESKMEILDNSVHPDRPLNWIVGNRNTIPERPE